MNYIYLNVNSQHLMDPSASLPIIPRNSRVCFCEHIWVNYL
jgi:hypothetical protein